MKNLRTLLIFVATFLITTCSDVLIPDISDEDVFLITPLENATLTEGDITFQWQGITDVNEYELQLATPSFAELETLVVDTLVNSDRITLPITAGNYEWSVRGINGGFSTNCCEVGRFTVSDGTVIDSVNSILLETPIDGVITNQLPVVFTWVAGSNFQSYNLQVATIEDFSSLQVNVNTPTPSFAISLLNETTYFWKVTGTNGNTFVESETASFQLDYNPPFQPVPISPSNNTTLIIGQNDPDFSWQQSTDVFLARLELFSDSLATSLVHAYPTAASAINLDTVAALPDPAEYFWRVTVRDQAGNFSTPSPIQRVVID